MTRMMICLSAIAAITVPTAVADASIPPRPEDIQFDELMFEPPSAREFRATLGNGVPVFLAPSHEFPLIRLTFTFKGGEYLTDPGVAGVMGAMMRRGGTATVSPETLDEELDFLAANVMSQGGQTRVVASLDCLSSNFHEAFALFVDMVRNPGFDAERFDVQRDEIIERLSQRNDNASTILDREWKALLYGRDHFAGRELTIADAEAMTVDDLRAAHREVVHPGNLVIAVTGDFERGAMVRTLEAAMAGWAAGALASDPPAPTATFTPGIYHVEKDIPQGKVYIGLRGITRDGPDAFPTMMMNHILGGSGFTSRITKRVRSDEGLAYSAGSQNEPGTYYPGEFRAFFQSKNRTVALATKITFEEFDRIRNEDVSAEELEVARNALIETFPRRFESKTATLNVFVDDHLTGREPEYWQRYRDRVRAVTKGDIRESARKYLVPENMAIFVVGKWDEIYAGDLEGRANMSEFFGGNVTHVPLREP